MKKIFSCILAIIILGAMLSGCSNNGSKEMIKKSEKIFLFLMRYQSIQQKRIIGILAYNFLHYIQDNYPGRNRWYGKRKRNGCVYPFCPTEWRIF